MERQFILYSELASLVLARQNCIAANPRNTEWEKRHTEIILKYVDRYFPHGSGFDSGTTLDLNASHSEKLVFLTSYHHMDDNGFYDGWTSHTVVVTPSLWCEFHIRITGRNRNEIKDHIHDQFEFSLHQEVKETWENGECISSELLPFTGGKRQ